jgi:hypothetical protein
VRLVNKHKGLENNDENIKAGLKRMQSDKMKINDEINKKLQET